MVETAGEVWGDPPPGDAPLARLADVTVALAGGQRLLGPVDWEARSGEHWALLGPNGAGKTTLLSLLAARRHPTSGRVDVLGEPLGRTDIRLLHRRIGVVSHAVTDRLPRGTSTREIVLTGLTGVLAPWWSQFGDDDRVRADELLGRFGCAGLADQAFEACSQGERQRVLLARALMHDVELLLLDEPAVGLDLPGRESLIAALEQVQSPGSQGAPGSLLVTQYVEELPKTTTHALLLRDGRAVVAGPVDEVLADGPLSECFGLEVRVVRTDDRWSATARASPAVRMPASTPTPSSSSS